MSPLPSLPSSPAHLTTLHVEAGSALPVLPLLKAFGSTLHQLSVSFQGSILPQEGLTTFATATSSLRHLRLDLFNSDDEMLDQRNLWFENLLPRFSQLERLLVSPDLVSGATVLHKLPPTIRWLELSAYSVPTLRLLDTLIYSLPSGTASLPLRQLAVTHLPLPFSADEVFQPVAAFRGKGVAVTVQNAASETVDVFQTG